MKKYKNPTFEYFEALLESIRYPDLYNCSFSTGFLLRLKIEFFKLRYKEIEYNLESGIIKYPLNFLPSKISDLTGEREIYIPLNLRFLISATNKKDKDKDEDRVFYVSPKANFNKETSKFFYTFFVIEYEEYEEYFETGIVLVFKSSIDNNLYAQLYLDKDQYHLIKLHALYFHKGFFNSYNHDDKDVIFWNYNKYKRNGTIDVKNTTNTLNNPYY